LNVFYEKEHTYVQEILMPPSFDSSQSSNQPPTQYGVGDYPVPQPGKPKPRWYLVPIVLLVLGLIGFGIWKFVLSDKPKPESNQNTASQDSQTSNTPTVADVPDATSTKEYSNGFMGLKLTHPDTWVVTEANNGVRLESPTFDYQTEAKGKVNGQFRIYIRKGARTNDGTYIGRGYAIQPSEKLTYSNPAPGQRTDTNLTLFGLDEPTNFAFFMIAGNYSLQKGDTLGPGYGKEAETYIIAGGFSEKTLTDDLATNPVNPDLLKTSNAYKQAVEILKSLQLR
jgi:hypothetical protein